MQDLAAVAVHLFDHLGIAQAVVGGVSMGGYAAFAFARRYPERLRGLVLSNTFSRTCQIGFPSCLERVEDQTRLEDKLF